MLNVDIFSVCAAVFDQSNCNQLFQIASAKLSMKDQISRRLFKNENEKKDIPEEEHFCYDLVEKIICKYAEELQENLNKRITPQQMRINMESDHRDKLKEYYKGCSEALLEYFENLIDLIKIREEKAYIQNNVTKENMTATLTCLIDQEIIAEEERLQKVMNDRYFNMDELESHYKNLKSIFLNNLASRATHFFLGSHIVEEFESIIQQRFDESLKKMIKINAKNIDIGIIISTEVPPNESIWKRINRFFRRLFGLD
uniref:uncharacterized protein LOC120343221 n=1 Tax=Styela clava TaxID=7725 RepID=UPI00193AD7DE|nr:uncharacterized protein LOC120343221 [Styela clava]